MFGYIKTAREELRVREYEYYRASYCGLCRSMGKCTGQCSRLTLSFDVAFLCNVRMALLGEKPSFKRRRCVAHPIRRRVMMEPNHSLRYGAYASAILNYEKCLDDVRDERGWRRFRARLRCLALRGAYGRAKKRYPELAAAVRDALVRLSQKEAEKNPTVDGVAAVFGELLSEIFSHGLEGEAKRIAEAIGRQTGRFIYIIDAADDMAEDEKKRRFNPFLLLYGGLPTQEEKRDVHDALISCLADMEMAFDLIDNEEVPERGEILKNILYLGMPATVKKVLFGGECRKEDDHGEQGSV